MRRTRVEVRWQDGLHARPAARLVALARRLRSTVTLRVGDRRADLRSILALLTLAASVGTTIDVEAVGEDEDRAVQAVERAFRTDADGTPIR